MHFTREQRDAWNDATRDSPFNCWLRDQVSDRSGALDLDRLHSVAAEYGVDAARYAHLNPGQQRMNVGNRLRKLVPEHVYSGASLAISRNVLPPPPPAGDPASMGSPSDAAHTANATGSIRELMGRYAAIIDELRERGIARTGNAPLGDYAEHLFASAFGWKLANNSAAGHDAVDAAGLRFQIKARRLRTNTPGERQLSVFRALPDAKFDMLAAILFDRHFGIYRAALIPHAIVVDRSAHITHVNGWRFILDDKVWSMAGVRDVTSALAAAASEDC